MVHVITPANRYLYEAELEDMFRMRYDVAVNEMGWSIPGIAPGYDKDDFDHDETIYFIEMDDQDRIVATARLNPTTRPHLMTEVFPNLCAFDGVPIGDDIYEYSRFLVREDGIDRRQHFQSRIRMSVAIVEYCLAADIHHITWVTYKRSYPLSIKIWKSRPLGEALYFEADDENYIAAISEMSLESLERTRARARTFDPVCKMTVPLMQAPHLVKLPAHNIH